MRKDPPPPASDWPTKCRFCDAYPSNLWRHENGHKGVKYKCPECDSETNDKSNLLKHMKTIHFQELSKCPTCRKEFKNISLRYYHECQRSYCDQCEKSFIHSNGLRRHIEMKHNGNKKYPCPHCDYKAGQKTHLRRHFIFKHQKSDFFLSVPINPENSSSEVEL